MLATGSLTQYQDAQSPKRYVERFPCSLGTYTLMSSETHMLWLAPEDQPQRFRSGEADAVPRQGGVVNAQAAQEITEYLTGHRAQFSVPMALRGTAFQREVWDALLQIPWGQTRSYGNVAQAIGRPLAVRAVGRAVGANPITLMVPCHRVVGTNGSLTGYAGGLDRKRALLALETGNAHAGVNE